MIATLSGKLQAREPGRVIIETAGVGYEVAIPLSTYYRLPPAGSPVMLEVRQVIREDSWQLYGFMSVAEKRAFDLLMLVQHVGPKLALGVLSNLSPDELVAAIGREDVARLDAVPGIGTRVAERIVRELRDKAADLKLIAPSGAAPTSATGGGMVDDAVSALVNLGYRPAEAKRAVDSILPEDGAQEIGLENVIRKALAVLASER
jgi:Holliday junction DNA helicase RuvA